MKNTDKEFLIGLLPDIYREIGKVIAGIPIIKTYELEEVLPVIKIKGDK